MTFQIDQYQLARQLVSLGVGHGDVVLVHSSLSGLGWVDGGADAVGRALLDAVGDRGTMLFPTLTGTGEDGPNSPPHIHLRDTPCWTGAIPEAARRHPEGVRSVHPTHSVTAIGARAEELTRGHEESASPCDARSPYVRLIDEGGKILLLGGVTHESNTTLHALEEMADVPYHLQEVETGGIVHLFGGAEVVVRNRLHLWGWERDFQKAGPILREAGVERHGRVGASTAVLVSANGLRDTILPLMQGDPLFLLSPDARAGFLRRNVP